MMIWTAEMIVSPMAPSHISRSRYTIENDIGVPRASLRVTDQASSTADFDRPSDPRRKAMSHEMQFYIDGQWVDPIVPASLDVIDPSTEEPFATISIGSAKDVDRAVAAAKAAFPAFSRTDRRERLELLQRVLESYKARRGDIARAISREVGAPVKFAMESQSATGIAHLERMIQVLRDFEFDRLPHHAAGAHLAFEQITCK